LTGQYIFDAETVAEIHEKQLTCAPIPPSQRIPQPINRELEQLLLRCLEKDADLRPASAGELRSLLLGTPAAADWTTEARVAWWEAYDLQPRPGSDVTDESTPMATVKIDMASRME